MLLPGYGPATCHKNNIVTLLVTSMLYYRNITCLLGYHELEPRHKSIFGGLTLGDESDHPLTGLFNQGRQWSSMYYCEMERRKTAEFAKGTSDAYDSLLGCPCESATRLLF